MDTDTDSDADTDADTDTDSDTGSDTDSETDTQRQSGGECFADLQWPPVQEICFNQTGPQGDYTYELFFDVGAACMEVSHGGPFRVEWEETTGDMVARVGLRPGHVDQRVSYMAEFEPAGNAYFGVYGWTTDPLVEYYIVENWGNWRPPGVDAVGTVESDNGTYDIYQTYPNIIDAGFFQFWSVRREGRNSGSITVQNHFDAWTQQGMN
ncbi:MAG: glycoside hydrolase family 11 protein, partial [Deltaproteobacteria bacterium]|nr:glycoside hydrolase family 11 protein [Deltaproteobacteria bacterium]